MGCPLCYSHAGKYGHPDFPGEVPQVKRGQRDGQATQLFGEMGLQGLKTYF